MEPYCKENDCSEGCCNYNGYCPNPNSDEPSERECYFQYPEDYRWKVWAIVGSFLFVTVVSLLILYLYFRKKPNHAPNKTKKDSSPSDLGDEIEAGDSQKGLNNPAATPSESYPNCKFSKNSEESKE